MPSAKARRTALRQLLVGGQPGTQAELCHALADQGFPATQSTVSRDLKVLGAQRVLRADGDYAYHLRTGAPAQVPGEMILAVAHNETAIVIRTRVGLAPAVGLDLDALRHEDILGTIAGDDTVLVIPRSVAATPRLAEDLRRIAGLEGAGAGTNGIRGAAGIAPKIS